MVITLVDRYNLSDRYSQQLHWFCMRVLNICIYYDIRKYCCVIQSTASCGVSTNETVVNVMMCHVALTIGLVAHRLPEYSVRITCDRSLPTVAYFC